MTPREPKHRDQDYYWKIDAIANQLQGWQGTIVLATHVDPDGDAVGSTLALNRALKAMGKATVVSLVPPRFLEFLAKPAELVPQVDTSLAECLVITLDAAAASRVAGVALESAKLTINIDHHGTNERFGDFFLVAPTKAATALIIKDLIERLGLAWTPDLSVPCLTGILTDTGFLTFGNTSPDVLRAAAHLLASGLDYAELTDRLQWRPRGYYPLLAEVMSTVEFALDNRVIIARVTDSMRKGPGGALLDSEDFIGMIRYAEGVSIAILLKERGDTTKVSIRTRHGVSAQEICLGLGGGGHIAAAGATVHAKVDAAQEKVLAAVLLQLEKNPPPTTN
jgi:phosphoesterase RecJ-like protein